MDVFHSTESTNNKRIKLVEFFGKVGHLILDSDQVGRLPVLMNWLLRLLVCELLTVALTAAGLVVYWFISTTVLQQYTVYKNDDFKKFIKLDDVDIEQVSSEKRKPRISSTPLRKLTLLLSLNMWLCLLLVIILTLHVNTNETKGNNLIQILIGDRSTTNLVIGTIRVTRPEKINDDMGAALEKWYDESLLLSFVFFTSYILMTQHGFTQISKLFPSKFVMFIVTLFGNLVMFLYINILYTYIIMGYLERIHPFFSS